MPGGGGGGGVGDVSTILDPSDYIDDFVDSVTDTVESVSDVVPDDPVGNIQDTVQDVVGDDPVGQFQEDVGTQADAAETSINETVATTMDTGQSNLEGILEDNNDTLIDMGNTFDYNVDQGNALLANTQAIVHDTTSIINQGAGAIGDIGNPDSFINSPVNWYEEVAGVGKGGWSLDGLEEKQQEWLEGTLSGTLGVLLSGTDDPWNQALPDDDEGGGGGQGNILTGGDMYSGRRAIQGDPFANPATTRRVVQQKEDFQSRLKKDQASSLINNA